MKSRLATLSLALALVVGCTGNAAQEEQADLILSGGEVWTGNPDQPRAEAVAIEDDRILTVGTAGEVAGHRGPETRVIELDGRFVAPGFIDNHTHFGRAGSLLLGVNLLTVTGEEGLVRAVRNARDRLPDGAWMTGGSWGAYSEWAQSSSGGEGGGEAEAFEPHRSMIDSITPANPVVLSRWDREVYLANGRAIEAAGVECSWSGVECDAGEPTGVLSPDAAERVLDARPEKPMERRLAEADTAFDRMVASGVTSFHDVTPAEQLRVYNTIKRRPERGELPVRVYARPILENWQHLRAMGIQQGMGDRWLRIGTLKGFVDGIMGNSSARFYEPYDHTGELGQWRDDMTEPPGMQELMVGADSSEFWFGIHAIGDHAIDTLLTMYSRMRETNGPRSEDPGGLQERRNRVIHNQVLRDSTVADRIADLGLIAEMQPYHAIDDMRWMEERIGQERSRWAYAFNTLEEAGVRLSFGSDWPGTNAAWYPTSPVLGMYAAVARKTLTGEPEGGWFPQERVSVETALEAYTINNAWASGTEDQKGSLEAGKLADVVVLDRSPFEVPADSLKNLKVLYTVIDGDVVFEASPSEAHEAVYWANKPSVEE